ncbi:1-acyl-sn-glycerol-3-phosphate acyltransferase [Cupriavidus basilensis]|jgi:1-acyl-sn-glycerol-3-phosphate acyltransferase|uniref:1-acyl-sn-glycerol-3-phosphate acyltransferase n=1 Tax=Cupriavidus basilensis TaxID=68895 RepID=UPI0020A62D19|nr:1-acyl-sn-glycerol-3-phosphate acyltransferase [Cupriavidus basilensis]MCP3024607.1 1-acyl-sn-glycerol-3-phosphate acyltransferase [Cupriavidus basilensis]
MRAFRQILRTTVLAAFRVSVELEDSVVTRLRGGRVIVVANHVSLLDGVLVALASPVPLMFGVDPDYARHSRFAMAGMRALTRMGFGDVVPLDRNSPYSMRTLSQRLNRDEAVMLFPEGAIGTGAAPLPDRPGVAWLSQRTGATIVYVQIRGAEQSRLFAKAGKRWWPTITLTFGRHLEPVR